MKERLQKIIARHGIASRRKAEALIEKGRVTVNGEKITSLGSQADCRRDRIAVDGIELEHPENKIYILLHKPRNCVSTMHDPQGRETVATFVGSIVERIFPVGRLDYDTEGLLVFTNDGHFSQILQHPRFGIQRIYQVKVHGIPSADDIRKLEKGISIDGRKTGPCKIRLLKKTDRNSWWTVTLQEGRYHQLKIMFERTGHRVMRIKRTEYGPLKLGRIKQGEFRYLKKNEIDSITGGRR